MWIYKISNYINNKVYIGQSKNNVKERFKRHLNDATSNRLDTHLARAIRKYGTKAFYIEIIEEVKTQTELNEREHYWINYFDSVNNGYNETDSILKCGGNTYLSKTPQEMEVIKEKIRQTKLGEKNPNHRKIIQINLETGEQIVFGSMQECARYHGVKNKTFVMRRCNGEIKTPYHKKYFFKDYDFRDVSTIPDECKGVG